MDKQEKIKKLNKEIRKIKNKMEDAEWQWDFHESNYYQMLGEIENKKQQIKKLKNQING